jgi:hypothetical protein
MQHDTHDAEDKSHKFHTNCTETEPDPPPLEGEVFATAIRAINSRNKQLQSMVTRILETCSVYVPQISQTTELSTECVSYSGDSGFEYPPSDRISCPGGLVLCPQYSHANGTTVA